MRPEYPCGTTLLPEVISREQKRLQRSGEPAIGAIQTVGGDEEIFLDHR